MSGEKDDLKTKMDKIGEMLRERSGQGKSDKTAASPGPESQKKALTLPEWADTRKAGPNAIFRGACFPALNRRKRQFQKNHKIGSVEGIEIYFTGEQFDQSDLDVYLVILDILSKSGVPFGQEVEIPAYTVLKALGLPVGGSAYIWLHSVIIRLRGGTFDITDHKRGYIGGLIDGGYRDKDTQHYRISVNRNLAALFGFGMWASIDWEQRQAMRGNQTAQAIHAYLSTHAAPGFHRFDTLAEVAGLTDSNPRRVKAKIEDAYKLMASDDVGFLSGYELSKDGESIKGHPRHTPSQARHIGRKIAKNRPKKPKT